MYETGSWYHDAPRLLKWILFFHFKLANFNHVPVHKSKIRSDSKWSGKSWAIRHFTLFHLAVPEFPDMSGQIPVCPRHHFDLWRERLELIILVSKQKWSPIKTQLNIPNTTNLRFQTSEMIADHQRNLGCFRKMEMSPALGCNDSYSLWFDSILIIAFWFFIISIRLCKCFLILIT